MNFNEAIDRACKEPTLADALAWISLWECERVIPIAHRYLNGESSRGSTWQGWETCFGFLIKEVLEQYGQQKTLKKLQDKK